MFTLKKYSISTPDPKEDEDATRRVRLEGPGTSAAGGADSSSDDAKLAELVSILSFDKNSEESFPVSSSFAPLRVAIEGELRSPSIAPLPGSLSHGDDFTGYVSKDGIVSLTVNFSTTSRVEPTPLIVFAIDTSASMSVNIKTIQSLLKLFYKRHPLFSYELIQFSSTAKLIFSSSSSEEFADPLTSQVRSSPSRVLASGSRLSGHVLPVSFGSAIDSELRCEGNTNYEAAFSLITAARNSSTNVDRHAFIVFMTDGTPTIGEISEEKLIPLLAIDKNRTKFISLGFPGIKTGISLLKKIGSYCEIYNGDLLTFLGSFSMEISKSFSFSAVLKFPPEAEIDVYAGDFTIVSIFPGQSFKFVGRIEEVKSLLVELEFETFSKTKRILRRRIHVVEKGTEEDVDLIRRVRLEELREKIVKSHDMKKRKSSDTSDTEDFKEEIKDLISTWPEDSFLKYEGNRIVKEDIYQIINSYTRQHDILEYYKTQFDYIGFFFLKTEQIASIESLIRSASERLPSNSKIMDIMKEKGISSGKFISSRTVLSDLDEESSEEEKGDENPTKRRGV